MKEAPLLTLASAVAQDILEHHPRTDTYGILFVPIVTGEQLTPGKRIVFEYYAHEVTLAYLDLVIEGNLITLHHLPPETKVPYTLFVCDSTFRNRHSKAFQFGHTAWDLIGKVIGGRA